MGISRDSLHKRRKTGGKKAIYRKKRKHTMGRPVTLTKMGQKRIRSVRTRGGHEKKRALRLDCGNFSWGSEAVSRKTRILDVVYNATDNELVRTKTIVKNCIVQVDAGPFKNWYSSHYNITLGKKKKDANLDGANTNQQPKKFTDEQLKQFEERQKLAKLEVGVEEQFNYGKLYACISSRPGQCGRADGYILEGRELEFYRKKIRTKKNK